MMNADDILKNMTPEIYRRFRTAIALRKWPDAKPLSNAQLEVCMQAIIAYEHKYVPENERTGYVPPKQTPCGEHSHDETKQPLKWQ